MDLPRHKFGSVLAAFLSLLFVSICSQAQKPGSDGAFAEQFDKGNQALKAGRYADAVSAFKRANKFHQNSCGDCYFRIAVAYVQMGDASRALDAADKSLSLLSDEPSQAVAHTLKGNVYLGLAKADSRQLKNAEEEFRFAVKFDENNPQYHFDLGRVLLMEARDADAKPELQTCLDLKPDTALVRQATRLMADPRRAREELAPAFQLTTLQGQDLSLEKVAGKIVVLDFWATWCPPCRESVGELKQLTRKYPAEKLVLISVSADDNEQAWRDFVTKKSMDWPQYRDTDHKILDTFHVHAFPTYLVITGDGIVKQRIVGLNPQQSVVYRLKDTLAAMPQLEGEARK